MPNYIRPERGDVASCAVPQRQLSIELFPHRIERRQEPILTQLVHDPLHQVGALTSHADEAFLAQLDRGPLCSRRNQRNYIPHEHAIGLQLRRRNIDDPHLPGLTVLKDLFHWRLSRRSGQLSVGGEITSGRSSMTFAPYQPIA